jgi:hypothetical protein
VSLISKLIGETTSAGGIPAVEAPMGMRMKVGTTRRRRRPVVKEEVEKSIIPDNAEEFETEEVDIQTPDLEDKPDDKPVSINGEELLHPSLALVAPDLTPDFDQPLDPAQVPAPANRVKDPVLRLFTQNSQPASQPPGQPAPAVPTAESAISMLPGIAQEGAVTGLPSGEMPPPVPGDAKKLMEAFRRFN